MRARFSPVKTIETTKPSGGGTRFPLARNPFSGTTSLEPIAAIALRARAHLIAYSYSFSAEFSSDDGQWSFSASGTGTDTATLISDNNTEGELAMFGVRLNSGTQASSISGSASLTGPDGEHGGTLRNFPNVFLEIKDVEFWDLPKIIALPLISTCFVQVRFDPNDPDFGVSTVTSNVTASTVQDFPVTNFPKGSLLGQYENVADWFIPFFSEFEDLDDVIPQTITTSDGTQLQKQNGTFSWNGVILRGTNYWRYGVDPDNPTIETGMNSLWSVAGAPLDSYQNIAIAKLLTA